MPTAGSRISCLLPEAFCPGQLGCVVGMSIHVYFSAGPLSDYELANHSVYTD